MNHAVIAFLSPLTHLKNFKVPTVFIITIILFMFASINVQAKVDSPDNNKDAGSAQCADLFNTKKDASWAIVFRKTGAKNGSQYTSGPFKGSLNFRQTGKIGPMIWAGYSGPTDDGFFHTGREITRTIFSPNFPTIQNPIEAGWEFNVLAIFRTNNDSNPPYWLDNKEYYGAFPPGMDLRVDVYIDFNDDSLFTIPTYYSEGPYKTEKSPGDSNTNPDGNNLAVTWLYLGTKFIKDLTGEWRVWSFPEDDSKNDCAYPKKYWPPFKFTGKPLPLIPENLNLSLSPLVDYSLMCDSDEDKSSIFTFETNVTAKVIVDLEQAEKFNINIVGGQGTGAYPDYISSNLGKLVLKITPKGSANVAVGDEYTLKAYPELLPSIVKSSVIKYVPYKLVLDDGGKTALNVIAGKPTDAPLKALACKNGSPTSINYNAQQLSIYYDFIVPELGVANLSYYPKFNAGKSTNHQLTVDNSGKFNVIIIDNNFDCTALGLDYCPFGAIGNLTAEKKLGGIFEVNARPWIFAICDKNNNPLPKDKVPFAKAGELFDIKVMPIPWLPNVDPPTDYYFPERDDYPEGFYVQNTCDRKATTNFFLNDSPKVNVTLSRDKYVFYPGFIDHYGNQLTGQLTKSNREGLADKTGIIFNNLSLEGAGSIYLVVDPIDYPSPSIQIDRSYAELGKFFPYSLSIADDAYVKHYSTYDRQHDAFQLDSFNYMDAVSLFNVNLTAKSKNGVETPSFNNFENKYKPKISMVTINRETGEDLSRRWKNIYWDNPSLNNEYYGDWTMTTLFRFQRRYDSPLTTVPDGPYNSGNTIFGVVSDGGVTDLHFMGEPYQMINEFGVEKGMKLPFLLDYRYGRMRLGNVSAAAGMPANIPLRVEYWNGSKFIVNDDDNGTNYAHGNALNDPQGLDENYCFFNLNTNRETDGYSVNKSNGLIAVKNGQGNILVHQDNPKKNSIKFNLMIGEYNNQYCGETSMMPLKHLLYNWEGQKDADPSALINFGQYRGSDRIIYRGEPM